MTDGMRFVYTLTRCNPSEDPPREAAGLETASMEAIARWKAAKHCFQFEARNMLITPDGSLRLPSLQERETLLGFDKGYTEAALPSKVSRDMEFNLRCSVLGNSFHVYSISFLVTHLLDELYHGCLNIPFEHFCWTSVADDLKAKRYAFGKAHCSDRNEGVQMLGLICRCLSDLKRGPDLASDPLIGIGRLLWDMHGSLGWIVT